MRDAEHGPSSEARFARDLNRASEDALKTAADAGNFTTQNDPAPQYR
jgi:hypothetical protein